ncbi:hypothetical protein HMPREF3213_00136 [Heyndrickxia coagulans]|uniref:Uncharacterized protein n=1 Tax=Heyndrickxia coagulans TaxID=1398 RepID=A0A133L3Q4_HEYCO|nr:hypothetical protein HMPREF3213_00136 [Heyndrickxia coagulans]
MDFFSILPLFSGVFRIIPIVIEFAADFHRQMLQNGPQRKQEFWRQGTNIV